MLKRSQSCKIWEWRGQPGQSKDGNWEKKGNKCGWHIIREEDHIVPDTYYLLSIFLPLHLITSLEEGCPHFIEEETESQSSEITFSKSHMLEMEGTIILNKL